MFIENVGVPSIVFGLPKNTGPGSSKPLLPTPETETERAGKERKKERKERKEGRKEERKKGRKKERRTERKKERK